MTKTIITLIEGFKVENAGEFKKRDTVMANAVNEFRSGQSELRGKLSKLETSLATIAPRLATISQSNKRSRIVEESDNSSESEEEEERPRKRKKKKKKAASANSTSRGAAASSTSNQFSTGCKFHPDMKWNHRWDNQTRRSYHQAQGEHAKTHPQYKKAVRAEKRARLQKAMNAFDNK